MEIERPIPDGILLYPREQVDDYADVVPDTMTKWITSLKWWIIRMSFLENAAPRFEDHGNGFIHSSVIKNDQKVVFLSEFFHIDHHIRPQMIYKNTRWKETHLYRLYHDLFFHPTATPDIKILCATFLLRETIHENIITELVNMINDTTITMDIKWDVYDLLCNIRETRYNDEFLRRFLVTWAEEHRWERRRNPLEGIMDAHHIERGDRHIEQGDPVDTQEQHRIVQDDINITTIYDDTQNVHTSGINECVRNGLCILREEFFENDRDNLCFFVTMSEIRREMRVRSFYEKFVLERALHRIRHDKSKIPVNETVTIGMQDVLVYVWNYIRTQESEEIRRELVHRLFEELVESSGTCGSGHVSRIINTVTGYHPHVRIGIARHDHLRVVVLSVIKDLVSSADDDDDIVSAMVDPHPKGVFVSFLRAHRRDFLQKINDMMEESVGIKEINTVLQNMFPTLGMNTLSPWWTYICPLWRENKNVRK